MADPTNVVPHLLGITLDSNGVANTLVVALNRRTGERQIKRTDGNKNVIFDALDFTSFYNNGDEIEFNNVGASVGQVTITISSASGKFQEATIVAAAAPTVSVNL